MHSTILVLSEDTDFEVNVDTLCNDANISKVVDYIGEERPVDGEFDWIKRSFYDILNVGKDERGFFLELKSEETRLKFVYDKFEEIENLVKEGLARVEKGEIPDSIFIKISEKLPLEQQHPLVYCSEGQGMTFEYFLTSVMDTCKKYYITQAFDYRF